MEGLLVVFIGSVVCLALVIGHYFCCWIYQRIHLVVGFMDRLFIVVFRCSGLGLFCGHAVVCWIDLPPASWLLFLDWLFVFYCSLPIRLFVGSMGRRLLFSLVRFVYYIF
jgi:hypothetical protein